MIERERERAYLIGEGAWHHVQTWGKEDNLSGKETELACLGSTLKIVRIYFRVTIKNEKMVYLELPLHQ